MNELKNNLLKEFSETYMKALELNSSVSISLLNILKPLIENADSIDDLKSYKDMIDTMKNDFKEIEQHG